MNEPEGCPKELLSIFLLHSVDLFRVTLLHTMLQKKVTHDEYNLKAVSLLQMDARPINVLIASAHSLKSFKMLIKATRIRGQYIYARDSW